MPGRGGRGGGGGRGRSRSGGSRSASRSNKGVHSFGGHHGAHHDHHTGRAIITRPGTWFSKNHGFSHGNSHSHHFGVNSNPSRTVFGIQFASFGSRFSSRSHTNAQKAAATRAKHNHRRAFTFNGVGSFFSNLFRTSSSKVGSETDPASSPSAKKDPNQPGAEGGDMAVVKTSELVEDNGKNDKNTTSSPTSPKPLSADALAGDETPKICSCNIL